MLGDCTGHQLVYYEDFHEAEAGEHFLDRFQTDDKGDPIKAMLEGDFRDALICLLYTSYRTRIRRLNAYFA